MAEDFRLSKVYILIQQKKYAEANQVLRQLLAENPNDAHSLSLLAEINLQQDKYDAARKLIDSAIGLSPASPHLYYIKSRIAIQEGNFSEAQALLEQSISLDAADADYYAMMAHIKLGQKAYNEALQFANKALELDAEHLIALNTRSTALLKLNKTDESFLTIEGALREDPNNAYTHANYGWGLLQKGDHKKALEHFKEALKNDPNFDYAQAGMMQALKANNPIYRVFLKYAFWMGNLTAKYQWGVIIGFYIALRILRSIAANNEGLRPYLTPLIVLLVLIAFSTWVISPISNLFLRFNKYGKFLLDRNEKMSSNFVAGSFALFLIGMLLYFALSDDRFLAVAVFGFAMMLPFGMMFTPSRYKNIFLVYAVVMAAIGLGAIALTFSTGELFTTPAVVFLVGFIAFQWVANYFMIKEDNR